MNCLETVLETNLCGFISDIEFALNLHPEGTFDWTSIYVS